MFEFVFDVGNYSERVVGRYDSEDSTIMVSTARVSDGRDPYETAVKHPEYNDGRMVIVESYQTKDEAASGHASWLEAVLKDALPEILVDCQNSHISTMLDEDMVRFERKRKSAA